MSGAITHNPIDTLVLHWDGVSWKQVPSPNIDGAANQLFGIAAISANDIWAVGYAGASATLRHWNGVYWTEKVCRATSTSNPPNGYEGGGPDSYFTGVSAVAANDVWVVGVEGPGPIILHWDGSAWTRVTHPRAFPDSAVLRAVTTSSDGSAWMPGST